MTSANISETLFFAQTTVNQVEPSAPSDGQFKNVLAKQTEASQSPEKMEAGQKSETPLAKTEFTRKSRLADTVSVAGNPTEEATVDMENLEEELEALGQEIMAFMAELFGVTPQQLEAFADSQGTEPVELVDSTVLSGFIRQFTQSENPMELLTNEQAFQDFKEVMNFAEMGLEKLGEQYKLSVKELETYASRNGMDMEAPEKAVDVLTQISFHPKLATDAKEAFDSKENQPVNLSSMEGNVEDGLINENPEEGIPAVNVTRDNQGKEFTGTKQEGFDGTKNPLPQSNQKEQAGTKAVHTETVQVDGRVSFNPFDKSFVSTQEVQGNYETEVSTADIMRQLMDYMKVSVKPETSDLEMQLHPQSLGNVQIHIANKEGTITAQFTTENEAVRATLEGQMIQLKERFEEQGIKVENIEVTVETHSFDQNLGQNQGRNEEGFAKQGRRATRSVLNASLSEAEMELLSDEDKLKLRMMESNGNQVDYKA